MNVINRHAARTRLRAYLSNRVPVYFYWPINFFHVTCYLWCATRKYPWPSSLSHLCYRFALYTLSFSKVLLFADDTKCIMPICSLQDCLQTDLSRLSDWCSTWNLPLNEEKCSAIHFKPIGHLLRLSTII